tara:strand:+ start:65 stop:409 length:345 start_codon:yes stop_codon:yes gene_type:complete
MNKLWIMPTVIISLYVLLIIFTVATNNGTGGALLGFTMAAMTDPAIFISSTILGLLASNKNLTLYLLTTFGGALVLTVVFHFMINTTLPIVDMVRFYDLIFLSSIIYLIKRKVF